MIQLHSYPISDPNHAVLELATPNEDDMMNFIRILNGDTSELNSWAVLQIGSYIESKKVGDRLKIYTMHNYIYSRVIGDRVYILC